MRFFIIIEDVNRGILRYTYIGQIGPGKETKMDSRENIVKNIVFYYATHGLDTGIYDFMTEQEWNTTPDDQFPANVNWHRVEVANQDDVETYIDAQNRYLRAAWTPNQDFDEREENSRIMKEMGQIMSRLNLSKHN